jgi:hypothetical protein
VTFAAAERRFYEPPEDIDCACDRGGDDCTCEQDAQDAYDDAMTTRAEWAAEGEDW